MRFGSMPNSYFYVNHITNKPYLYLVIAVGVAAVMSYNIPHASAFIQGPDLAILNVYTDVPWWGTMSTLSNSTSISNFTENSSYPFLCRYGDNYTVTIQSAGSTGTGVGVWTAANIVQDNIRLDVSVNHIANGLVSLSGQCHVSQYPMLDSGVVNFTTDKIVYHYGEPIQISGTVLPELERKWVLSSTIIDSNGMIMKQDRARFYADNNFYFYVTAHGGIWHPGNYTVFEEIAHSTAQENISIVPASQSVPAQVIPSWFKNTAKMWSEGKISDSEFVQAVQYLEQQGTITVPSFHSFDISTASMLSWIRSSAGQWADGKMTDGEFLGVLKYLNWQA